MKSLQFNKAIEDRFQDPNWEKAMSSQVIARASSDIFSHSSIESSRKTRFRPIYANAIAAFLAIGILGFVFTTQVFQNSDRGSAESLAFETILRYDLVEVDGFDEILGGDELADLGWYEY